MDFLWGDFMFPTVTRSRPSYKVVYIRPEEIERNPMQPRKSFIDDDIAQLAESIKQNGLLQPLTVRRTNKSTYQLIAGERRLRASMVIGLPQVPCIVMEVSERSSAILALVENIQRENLSYFDEAAAICSLIEAYGLTQEDAALKLGRAQSTIANKLRLLQYSEKERKLLSENNLTERHARAFLRVKDVELRINAIETAIKRALNVEKTEQMIEDMIIEKRESEMFQKRCVVFRDVRLFVNTINKAIETMKAAGIEANSKKTQTDDYIEYVVRIPVK